MTSRHSILAALLALTPLAPALAQEAAAPDAQAAEASGEVSPVLYLMEDEDSRVYLLGSVHVLDEGSYPLPANVEEAYADAEAVAFEIDMSDMAAIQSAVMTRAQYADGRTLQDAMGESFAALEARVGPAATQLSGFEPWAVQLTLVPLALQGTGYTATSGVDQHFLGRATADAKERLALETADSQMAIFDGIPEETQVEMLLETLNEWDAMSGEIEGLIAAWKSGEDEAMEPYFNDIPDSIRPALLRDRNAAWVPQIEAMLAREGEDVLVVVGAGHLVGADSVIMMLREKGYTLTRL
ncbi:TraB/GumN family protein [Rubricoccus marinus]|uniref:TraB/GumN family protein n=1 Tax=Rubricoccus marinus TaxID=716817 RepID=A0A259U1C0_9BACT|nr:TraB/GumN family protein [Rubricoccus marinus]OZC03799.1 hypothetical protein BSZ36_12875 [Rubricoccus marinus]